VKDEEENEENVEVVSVEEELKSFTPNTRDGCNPHQQTSNQSYLSTYI